MIVPPCVARALWLLAVLPVLVGLSSSCATTVSTLQTARPVPKGHVQATMGAGLYLPLGPVVTLVKEGVVLVDRARVAVENKSPMEFNQADAEQLLTAGLALAVFPPSTSYELSVRTGLARDVDLGLRYSINALRLDAKYRFYHSGDEGPGSGDNVPFGQLTSGRKVNPEPLMDLAVGLAVSKYLFKSPLIDVLEYVQLGDFSRWDLEVPLYASAEIGEVFKLFAAPKYLFSRTSFDEQLVGISEFAADTTGLELALPARVDSHFVGLSAGIGIGYRWVHLMLELTGGYTFCSPRLFGAERSLGGVTLYPAAALNVRL